MAKALTLGLPTAIGAPGSDAIQHAALPCILIIIYGVAGDAYLHMENGVSTVLQVYWLATRILDRCQ